METDRRLKAVALVTILASRPDGPTSQRLEPVVERGPIVMRSQVTGMRPGRILPFHGGRPAR